jgi:hypothetical protein
VLCLSYLSPERRARFFAATRESLRASRARRGGRRRGLGWAGVRERGRERERELGAGSAERRKKNCAVFLRVALSASFCGCSCATMRGCDDMCVCVRDMRRARCGGERDGRIARVLGRMPEERRRARCRRRCRARHSPLSTRCRRSCRSGAGCLALACLTKLDHRCLGARAHVGRAFDTWTTPTHSPDGRTRLC